MIRFEPGDLIKISEHSTFKVRGVHLGGENQENLIEMESNDYMPGRTGINVEHPYLFIPERMLVGLLSGQKAELYKLAHKNYRNGE